MTEDAGGRIQQQQLSDLSALYTKRGHLHCHPWSWVQGLTGTSADTRVWSKLSPTPPHTHPETQGPSRLSALLLPEAPRERPDRTPRPPAEDRPREAAGAPSTSAPSGDCSLSVPATGRMPATARRSGAQCDLPVL